MAKRIHPSSWNRDPAKAQAPGLRERERHGRTSSHAAMPDPAMRDDALFQILQRRFPDQDTTGFTVADFVYAAGSPVDALLYSWLFWPALLEVDGAILLRDGMEDEDDLARVRASVRERGIAETERRFNLRELSDLFGKGLADIDDDQAEALLVRLAEMWRGRLHKEFPGRCFAVEVLSPADTGGDIGICFHQSEAQPGALSAAASG